MNKPTFNSARLRAAALALCLAQTFLAPVAAVAASEPPIKLMSLRGAEINASDPEGDGTRYGRDQPPLPRLGARQGNRRNQDLGHPLQDP